jgi:hypothetical protein
VVEGRQDAGGKWGWAPALDELDHRVQVKRAVRGDPPGETRLDSSAHQAPLTPPGQVLTRIDGGGLQAGRGG